MCGFDFFYFCLLILGGEHIEGIDFSTTIFGIPMKNPMKNSFTHREFRECFWSVFLRFFFTSGAIFFLDFSSFFFFRLFAWLLLNLTFGKEIFGSFFDKYTKTKDIFEVPKIGNVTNYILGCFGGRAIAGV